MGQDISIKSVVMGCPFIGTHYFKSRAHASPIIKFVHYCKYIVQLFISMETCPVCNNQYDKSSIEVHVNSHFDEEPVRKRVKREEEKETQTYKVSSSPPSSSSSTFSSTSSSLSSSSFPSQSSCSSTVSKNKKDIKCHNCGESVPSWDWNRHSSVHDDEAIAVKIYLFILILFYYFYSLFLKFQL